MPSCEWNPYFISSNFSFFHHRSERWLMLLFCSVLSEAHSVCALHIHFQPCCNCHDREMTFSSHYLLFICLSGLICHTVSLWHFLWFVLAVAMELWHIVTQRHRQKCKCRPCLSLDAAALTSPRLQSWRPWLFFFPELICSLLNMITLIFRGKCEINMRHTDGRICIGLL